MSADGMEIDDLTCTLNAVAKYVEEDPSTQLAASLHYECIGVDHGAWSDIRRALVSDSALLFIHQGVLGPYSTSAVSSVPPSPSETISQTPYVRCCLRS